MIWIYTFKIMEIQEDFILYTDDFLDQDTYDNDHCDLETDDSRMVELTPQLRIDDTVDVDVNIYSGEEEYSQLPTEELAEDLFQAELHLINDHDPELGIEATETIEEDFHPDIESGEPHYDPEMGVGVEAVGDDLHPEPETGEPVVGKPGNYESSVMHILQLNSRKTRESNDCISQLTSDLDSFVVLIQEPYYNKANKTLGLDPQHKKLDCEGRAPEGCNRAIIYCHRNLNVWRAPNYCTRDLAAALWITGNESHPNIMLISYYWDAQVLIIAKKLHELIRHCREKGYEYILGTDSNAYSELWGERKTGRRGAQIEGLINQYNMVLLNDGDKWTFEAEHGGKSKIDLTLVSPGLASHMANWRVTDEDMESDHNLIRTELVDTTPEVKMVRKLSKVVWDQFKTDVEKATSDWELPEEDDWTIEKIEEVWENGKKILISALDDQAPLEPVKIMPQHCRWFTPELKRMKKAQRKARKRMKRKPTEDSRAEYRLLHNAYKSACKKARKESWKLFTTGVENISGMARLSKIMKGQPRYEINMLEKEDGTQTESPAESMDLIMDQNFPQSEQAPVKDFLVDEMRGKSQQKGTFTPEGKDWRNLAMVQNALKAHKTGKSAGPDEVSPEMLANLPESFEEKLSKLFDAVLTSGHTPLEWRKARVVFIPKPGKTSYSKAKSFRPISLQSFAFKTLEKLAYWHINNTSLKEKPYAKTQHAFRAGYSTETALSQAVNEIEKGTLRRGYTLAIFLDVSAAFDTLSPEAAIQAMKDRKIDEDITSWYADFLTNRFCTVNMKGIERERKLKIGCPQGGVLSVLLWNLVFDDLLNRYAKGRVKIVGFADDGALLIHGKTLPILYRLMQKAIDKAAEWADEKGLTLSKEKTVTMLFTRKRKSIYKDHIQDLSLNGHTLTKVEDCRYLGLTLDSRLNWNKHILDKIAKARRILHMTKTSIGKIWGPSPEMMKWCYTACVRPALTYESFIWGQGLTALIRKKLSSLQRLGLMQLGHFRKGTPSAGLDVITDTLPLHLQIQTEMMKTVVRLGDRLTEDWDGERKGLRQQGHIHYAKNLTREANVPELFLDPCLKEKVWEKNFDIIIEDGTEDYIEDHYNIYTDGSKLQDGATGAGFYMSSPDDHEEDTSETIYLGKMATVFQGEVEAIMSAADHAADRPLDKPITIFSDSQAAIQALKSWDVTSNTVKNCIGSLNTLAKKTRVTIRWIRAHVGHQGNERADTLAKEGASSPIQGCEPYCKIPKAETNKMITAYVTKKWNEEWALEPKCRQTKFWFPARDAAKSKRLLQLGRPSYSAVVRWITGHSFHRRHSSICQEDDEYISPTCRLCKEEDETPIHLSTDCPAIAAARSEIFMEWLPRDPFTWHPDQLVQLMAMEAIAELEDTSE